MVSIIACHLSSSARLFETMMTHCQLDVRNKFQKTLNHTLWCEFKWFQLTSQHQDFLRLFCINQWFVFDSNCFTPIYVLSGVRFCVYVNNKWIYISFVQGVGGGWYRHAYLYLILTQYWAPSFQRFKRFTVVLILTHWPLGYVAVISNA